MKSERFTGPFADMLVLTQKSGHADTTRQIANRFNLSKKKAAEIRSDNLQLDSILRSYTERWEELLNALRDDNTGRSYTINQLLELVSDIQVDHEENIIVNTRWITKNYDIPVGDNGPGHAATIVRADRNSGKLEVFSVISTNERKNHLYCYTLREVKRWAQEKNYKLKEEL